MDPLDVILDAVAGSQRWSSAGWVHGLLTGRPPLEREERAVGADPRKITCPDPVACSTISETERTRQS